MQRSRREIKTPKRFDDEPFETPRCRHHSASKSNVSVKLEPQTDLVTQEKEQEQDQQTSVTTTSIKTPTNNVTTTHAHSAPNASNFSQTPTKQGTSSIRSTPETRGIIKVKLTRPKALAQLPQLDTSVTSTASPSTAPSTPTNQPSTPKSQAQTKQQTNKQLASTAKQCSSPKQSLPARQSMTPRLKSASTVPKSATKSSSAYKTSSLAKVARSAPIVRLPDPELISVPRPKRERPRTPPVYPDVIPNVVLPFWDARTAAEDHEDDNVKELVHCQCGIAEELGLMVQCETCLTWQHANCLGIERAEDVPDGYTCRACSDPRFVRESKRWDYDMDWIVKGRMKQFACDKEPLPEKDVRALRDINQLISETLKVYQLIHSLRVKSRILETADDDDPELKLFRNPWPANYLHHDGSQFISSITNFPDHTGASLSVIGETPDPTDLQLAETVVEAALPDIGQLGDVSALLDNTDLGSGPMIQPMASDHEPTPNDCRSNLRLHIQQTEEFIGIELSHIEQRLTELEVEFMHSNSACGGDGENKPTVSGGDNVFKVNGKDNNNMTRSSFETLKNDLRVMRDFMKLNLR